jgi:Arc/MetJ family transcription regulator
MYNIYMLTNIDLDEDLVEAAMRLTGERTKRGVVHRALQELVRVEQLRGLRSARGSLKWEGNLTAIREDRTRYGTTRRHKRAD